MNAHGWRRSLVEVAVGRGAPGSLPRRPHWLHQYGQPILVFVTLALCLAARASVLPSGWLNQAVAILGVLPLALFPVAPLAAWRVGFVAMILSQFYGAPHETAWPWSPVMIVVMLLVLFAVAATQHVSTTILVAVATGAAVVWQAASGNRAGILILLTLIFLAGDQVRRRARAQRELAGQTERSAVLAERTRIARELHDVVAHHMSMIAVRAETAPYRIADLSDAAKVELSEISTAARESLVEMRRLLGVLRSEQSDVPLAPQPGLADIADLVAGARRAGASIQLRMPDPATGTAASPAVQLTAYRIVQEALSNTGRHAPNVPATVRVEQHSELLAVTVSNGPSTRADTDTGPGHGLVGMRERATAVGGTLSAGPDPSGGYVVHAELPLTGGDE